MPITDKMYAVEFTKGGPLEIGTSAAIKFPHAF
jgi:hypothetical protein